MMHVPVLTVPLKPTQPFTAYNGWVLLWVIAVLGFVGLSGRAATGSLACVNCS
jgi:hypothetical protein